MFDQLAETIVTERLRLRPVVEADAGALSLYAGDARVARMTTSLPHPYPPGAAAHFIAGLRAGRHPERVWAMDGSAEGGAALIGLISVKAKPVPELGYWVGPPFWNTGYASEAVRGVLVHLLEAGHGQISAEVFADNPASARVLEHNGFRETGSGETYSVARGGMVPMRIFLWERGQ